MRLHCRLQCFDIGEHLTNITGTIYYVFCRFFTGKCYLHSESHYQDIELNLIFRLVKEMRFLWRYLDMLASQWEKIGDYHIIQKRNNNIFSFVNGMRFQ